SLAELEMMAGDLPRARRLAAEALAIGERDQLPQVIANSLNGLATIDALASDLEAAHVSAARARANADELRQLWAWSEVLLVEAALDVKDDDTLAAVEKWSSAVGLSIDWS